MILLLNCSRSPLRDSFPQSGVTTLVKVWTFNAALQNCVLCVYR